MSDQAVQPGYRNIEVRTVSANIGAEIVGVDASGPIDPATVAEIRLALLRNRVVFLRGQDHVTDDTHAEFAALFGTVTKPHPTAPGTEEAVLPVDSAQAKANAWHTDVTFVDRIPAISILRAVTLPPFGGSTLWANTVRAYELLPAPLQALVDNLWALHTNIHDYARLDSAGADGLDVKEEEFRREFQQHVFETEHPVVRIHPETGERTLLVGDFIRYFLDLNSSDSEDVFRLLQRHITRIENTVRWSWEPGDIGIWDNRATQHYAVDDYADLPRRMHRITVAGDVPVNIDGVRSVIRKGDASHYSPIEEPEPVAVA